MNCQDLEPSQNDKEQFYLLGVVINTEKHRRKKKFD